jgi:hypothetical protein
VNLRKDHYWSFARDSVSAHTLLHGDADGLAPSHTIIKLSLDVSGYLVLARGESLWLWRVARGAALFCGEA